MRSVAVFDVTIRTMKGCLGCSNLGYVLRFDPSGEDDRLIMARCTRCAGRSAEVEFYLACTNGNAWWINWPTETVRAWILHAFNT